MVSLGHWKQGLTTAFLEGLNSLFSATKRKARGYRSTEHQIAMLDFVAGKLEIPYHDGYPLQTSTKPNFPR
jgi:hypothetical protein